MSTAYRHDNFNVVHAPLLILASKASAEELFVSCPVSPTVSQSDSYA